MKCHRALLVSALTMVLVPATVLATPTPVSKAGEKAKVGAEKRRQAAEELRNKSQELTNVTGKAQEVSARIAAVAADPALANSAEGAELMRELVKELQDLNERVQKLQEDVEEIKGWIEGQNETIPILEQSVTDLQRFRPTFYAQFQYRDSNERTSTGESTPSQHAWVFRRLRFGFQYTVDPATSIRMSFDASTGAGNDAFQLRDAILQQTFIRKDTMVGTELTAGQQAVPLGFELERSSGDREFPERTRVNRVMFNGERTRSVLLRHGIAQNAFIVAGMTSSLTFLDAEQSTTASGRFGRHGFVGALRFESPSQSYGVGIFQAERPSLQGNPTRSADVWRNWTYFDYAHNSLFIKGLDVRGELIYGNDRIPNASAGATAFGVPMRAFSVQALYNISSRNQIFWRHAEWDPNTRIARNNVRETGIGYRYYINPGASVTFSYEWFRDPGIRFDTSYQVATLRYQFRF